MVSVAHEVGWIDFLKPERRNHGADLRVCAQAGDTLVGFWTLDPPHADDESRHSSGDSAFLNDQQVDDLIIYLSYIKKRKQELGIWNAA